MSTQVLKRPDKRLVVYLECCTTAALSKAELLEAIPSEILFSLVKKQRRREQRKDEE